MNIDKNHNVGDNVIVFHAPWPYFVGKIIETLNDHASYVVMGKTRSGEKIMKKVLYCYVYNIKDVDKVMSWMLDLAEDMKIYAEELKERFKNED